MAEVVSDYLTHGAQEYIWAWGDGPTGYYGQTFVAAGSDLQKIEFEIDGFHEWYGGSNYTDYTVIVASITKDGNGNFVRPDEVLFTSAPLSYTSDSTHYNWERVSVDVSNLQLTEGETYVFLLNANYNGNSGQGAMRLAANNNSQEGAGASDPTGSFVYFHGNLGSVQNDFDNGGWYFNGNEGYGWGDLAYRLTYGEANDPPVANDETLYFGEDDAATDITAALLANDTDPDGDTLKIQQVDFQAGPPNFIFDGGAVTTFPDDPDLDALAVGETASVSFTYKISDPDGLTDTATATIVVQGRNDAPTAVADTVAVDEDATTANLWGGLLGNDTDIDHGAAKKIVSVDTIGTLGTVALNSAGQSLTFTADDDSTDLLAPGAVQTTSFTYTMEDEHGAQSTATVTVDITALADGRNIVTGNGADLIVVGSGATNTSAGEDTVKSGNSNDVIYAGGGADQLYGEFGDDQLYGEAGRDLLVGDRGNDTLNGGLGNDTLNGGAGNDRLDGGDGADRFVFDGLSPSTGADTIVGFSGLGGDRIVLAAGATFTASAYDSDLDTVNDATLLTLSNGGTVVLSGVTTFDNGWVI